MRNFSSFFPESYKEWIEDGDDCVTVPLEYYSLVKLNEHELEKVIS